MTHPEYTAQGLLQAIEDYMPPSYEQKAQARNRRIILEAVLERARELTAATPAPAPNAKLEGIISSYGLDHEDGEAARYVRSLVPAPAASGDAVRIALKELLFAADVFPRELWTHLHAVRLREAKAKARSALANPPQSAGAGDDGKLVNTGHPRWNEANQDWDPLP